MKRNLLKNAILMAFEKPTLIKKFIYISKAKTFYFPLLIEKKSFFNKETDDELLGDDIYPLF